MGSILLNAMRQAILSGILPVLPVRVVRPLFTIPRTTEVLQWHNHRDLDLGDVWLRSKIIAALPALLPPGDSVHFNLNQENEMDASHLCNVSDVSHGCDG